MLSALLRFLLLLLVAYCLYAALLWSRQSSLMYPIAGGERRPMRALPPGATAIETGNGVRAAWLPAPHAAPRAPAVVFMHGNAELVEDVVRDFETIAALGVHVLLVEYPGYGGAPGAPGFESLSGAAEAGYDWLAARPEVDPERIVAMGISIGGGPAAELTRRRSVRALVLQSTFANTDVFARSMGVPGFLVRDRFDNLARVAAFAGPTLILHGRHDEVIAFAHGQALARAQPHARFVALDCGHNDCFYRGPEFARLLGTFLREAGVLAEPAPDAQ